MHDQTRAAMALLGRVGRVAFNHPSQSYADEMGIVAGVTGVTGFY
jgi:hypothetical protein